MDMLKEGENYELVKKVRQMRIRGVSTILAPKVQNLIDAHSPPPKKKIPFTHMC